MCSIWNCDKNAHFWITRSEARNLPRVTSRLISTLGRVHIVEVISEMILFRKFPDSENFAQFILYKRIGGCTTSGNFKAFQEVLVKVSIISVIWIDFIVMVFNRLIIVNLAGNMCSSTMKVTSVTSH